MADRVHRTLLVLDAQRQPKRPESFEAWLNWMRAHADDGSRQVGYYRDRDLEVSTAFLGIDMGYRRNASPLGFESLVWQNGVNIEAQRYTSWTEAEQGHARLVQFYRGVTM